jgi:plasmid stabilization system protein ParE
MMRVRISGEVLAELRAIADRIAEDNKVRAASFTAELLERCFTLGDHSERYPVVMELSGQAVRRASYRNYLIFYVIRPDEVRILHIVHSARDYVRTLFPDA